MIDGLNSETWLTLPVSRQLDQLQLPNSRFGYQPQIAMIDKARWLVVHWGSTSLPLYDIASLA